MGQRDVCQGWYTAHGERVRCPIFERCQRPQTAGHQLEFLHPRKNQKTAALAWEADPSRTAAHDKRRVDIMQAFGWGAEDQRAYFTRHPEKREQKNERQREKKALQSLLHPKPVRERIPPPPCGGDHRNCPYDGECKYPDWAQTWRAGEPKRRWAAILADPIKHAEVNKKRRKRAARNKFIKSGGTPEEFEKQWKG